MKCGGPIMVKNPAFEGKKAGPHTVDRMVPVRCGKCEGCLKSNINSWSFRLSQEGRIATSVSFVTLTYNPEHVPLTQSLLPTLCKRSLQLFLKRLRKHNRTNIKYFAVGEYGSKSYRPHYHIILFNVQSAESIYKAWSLGGSSLGNVHIGNTISDGAIPYTLKYMYKKGLIPAFENDDRLPEFRMMSKNLGQNYLSKQIINYHLKDLKNRQYVVNNGYKIAMPRYYREKLIKLSNKPRELLRTETDLYPTTGDGHFLTVKSRMESQKMREKRFNRDRQQINRIKI